MKRKEKFYEQFFEDLRIVDNFYQTSLFFPMPTVIISTLCEDGSTNLGPYSLVQPYYVAEKDYYAMLLCCRNSSNTLQNILRTGKCALNFIDDNTKTGMPSASLFLCVGEILTLAERTLFGFAAKKNLKEISYQYRIIQSLIESAGQYSLLHNPQTFDTISLQGVHTSI